MSRLRVAIVTRDPAVRTAAAKAFDAAPAAWSVRLCDRLPEGADVVVAGPDVSHEVSGVAFDPADPGRIVDDVARARPSVVAASVTGACGGAGATSIALHLAATLGACLVDLSEDAAAARRLGIDEVRMFAEGDDARGASVPVAPGFRLLSAPGAPHAVAAAVEEFDRVVVDCAAAPLPDAVRPWILVVPPSLPAARRARALMDAERDRSCAIVMNRTGSGGTSTRFALEAILGQRAALWLPPTPSLRDAEDAGRLLTAGWTRWWRGIRRVALALEDA
ncbi:MAG TPA: hypothetical protein VM784_06305 [Actinomycetota bacterium]|nr:hypothetical protein [Actinomycetota bacterium]